MEIYESFVVLLLINDILSCIWRFPGFWAVVSGYKFLMFRLHLWQASSEVAVSTVASEADADRESLNPEILCSLVII